MALPPSKQSVAAKRKRRHHLSHKKSSMLSAAPIRSEINVTPLVDVVLVLLIIFMVVTPMLSRGVDVELPDTSHHDKKNDTGEQLVVSITDDGKVYVGADRANNENEVAILVRKQLSAKVHDVHVKADKRLEYGKVRAVLEKIHEAGAAQVALATREPKD